MPLVSIIIPLHNKGQYVAETIISAQQQSLPDWEALVVENHSSDDGPAKVEAIATQDPRIRLIRAPESVRGPGAARNHGLDLARSEWVLFLDADDWIESNHLENLLDVARQGDVDIAATGWKEFREDQPEQIESKSPMGRGQPGFVLADHTIAFAPWAVHCALIRRACLTSPFRWPEQLDQFASEDTAFWFKLICEYSVACSDQNSAVYRTHTPNYRNRFDDMAKWFAAMDAVTSANVEYLASRGREPNAKQCENLMRLWADVADRARSCDANDIERDASSRAQHWLNECRRKGGIDTWSLRLRSMLSIPRFRQLRSLLRLR